MEIGDSAFSDFSDTNLEGTLVILPTVATIGNAAFKYTNLTRLDLSKVPSLVWRSETASSVAPTRGLCPKL